MKISRNQVAYLRKRNPKGRGKSEIDLKTRLPKDS